ncbi:MAG: DNA double-strand break repair nuclease NurA [Thermofilaceae archaeon]
MAEDLFNEAFSRRLGEALLGLKPPKLAYADVYLGVWHGFDGFGDVGRFAVADGSCASTVFRGGFRVVVVRAAALSYEGWRLAGSVCDVDVKAGLRLRRASLYMRALEFSCLSRVLDGVSLAICDGHIYPTVHPAIYKGPRQVVDAYRRYLFSLLSLFREAWRRGAALVGLVKDSSVNYVRARLLANAALRECPEVAQALARERGPAGILRVLRGAGVSGPIIDELESFTSDEEVFDECVKEPGFSIPLALAPQPIFFGEEVKAGVESWWESRLRERLLRAGGELREVAEVLDGFYEMPPTATFYWRPWHGIGVFRVDISGWSLGLNGPCGDMGRDVFVEGDAIERCRGIVAALNALSPEPYAVKPLLDADLVVRLSRREYREFYEPQIIEEMRKAGFKPQLAKRRIREEALAE